MKKSILSVATATFITCLSLVVPAGVTAQTFTTLHSFTTLNSSANSDGANPWAGLILSGNTLYGTASGGGSSGNGIVFAINTNGTGFTNLHSFTQTRTNTFGFNTNSDGTRPLAGLILSSNTLNGTTEKGGSFGGGTVFKLNTDGMGFTNLHTFIYGSDGDSPLAGLILSGNTLYGTADVGGSSGRGTVFEVNTDGTGFTNLHSFADSSPNSSGNFTNSDGTDPWAGLILSGNTLYGTALGGGSSGNGTVFAASAGGLDFTNLHNFAALSTNSSGAYTNSDGANPYAGLILSGNTLYGTARSGGNSGHGTVFAVNTNGTAFAILHSFTGGNDGGFPRAGLILSGNTLYGTAYAGGSSGQGTVFAVNADGIGFTNLHSFTATSGPLSTNSDGANPQAGLILSSNTLYGTAANGGSSGNGTVFSLTLPAASARPRLTAILAYSADMTGADYYSGYWDTLPGAGDYYDLFFARGLPGGSPDGITGTLINGPDDSKVNVDLELQPGTNDFTVFAAGPVFPWPAQAINLFFKSNQVLRISALTTLKTNSSTPPFSANGSSQTVALDGSHVPGTGTLSYTNSSWITSLSAFSWATPALYGVDRVSDYSAAPDGANDYVGSISLVVQAFIPHPVLSISLAATNVILTWATNTVGFTLQSSTNLVSPAVWTTVSPGPVVINGQSTVTNPISGAQKFYRLSQ